MLRPFAITMPRPKKQSEAPPTQDPSTALIGAVRALTDQLETLTHEVGTLAGRAQVLTEAIDDVRCELEWAIRNSRPRHITHVESPPPASSPEFNEPGIASTPADLPPQEPEPVRQPELWK